MITPFGRFGSGRLAADIIGICHSTLWRRIRLGVPGWALAEEQG
jgi:hypothetical protein